MASLLEARARLHRLAHSESNIGGLVLEFAQDGETELLPMTDFPDLESTHVARMLLARFS